MQAWMVKAGAGYIGTGGTLWQAQGRQAQPVMQAQGVQIQGRAPACRGVLVCFLRRACLHSLREFLGY